jgi:hypothetical protein
VENWRYLATSGLSSSTTAITMIPKILGTAFSEAFYLSRWVAVNFFCIQGPIVISQGYKHIFTSPSSVEKEPKATRSGNARLHGMTQVTPASIAYVATQVFDQLQMSSSYLPADITADEVCAFFVACLLSNGYCNRLREIL